MEGLASAHRQFRPGQGNPPDIHGNRRLARHCLKAPNTWGITPGELSKSEWGWTRWRWLPQPTTATPYSAKDQLRITKLAGSGISSSFRTWKRSTNPFLKVLSTPRDVVEDVARKKRPGYLTNAETYFVPGWARNLVLDVNKMETTLEDVVKRLNKNNKGEDHDRPMSSSILNKWLKSARKVPIPETETTLAPGTRQVSGEKSSSGKPPPPGGPYVTRPRTTPTGVNQEHSGSSREPVDQSQEHEPRTPAGRTASEPSSLEEGDSTPLRDEPPTHLVLQTMKEELASIREAYENLYNKILDGDKREAQAAEAGQESGQPPAQPSQPRPTTLAVTATPNNPPPIQPTRYFRDKIERLELEKAACERQQKRQQRIIDRLLGQAKTRYTGNQDDSSLPNNSVNTTGSSAVFLGETVNTRDTGTVDPAATGTQPATSQPGNAAGDKTLEQKLRELLGMSAATDQAQNPNATSASAQPTANNNNNTTMAPTYSSTATQTANTGDAQPGDPKTAATPAAAPAGVENVIVTAKQQVHGAFRALRTKLYKFSRSAAFQLDGPMSFDSDMQKKSGEQPFCNPQLWDRLTPDQRANRICELIFVWLWRQILRPGVESFGVKAVYDPVAPETGWRTLEVEMGLAEVNAPRLTPQQVASQTENSSPLRKLARAIAPIGERIFRTLSPAIQFAFSRNEQLVRQQIWGICQDAALLKMMFRQVPEKQMKVEVPGVHGDQTVDNKWGEQGFDELTHTLPFSEWVRLIDTERFPGKRTIVCVPFGALTLINGGKKVVLERAWIVGNSDEKYASAGTFVLEKPGDKRKSREGEQGADPRAEQGDQGGTPGEATGKRNRREKPGEKEKPDEKENPGEKGKSKEANQSAIIISTDHDDEDETEFSSDHDDLRKDPTWRPSNPKQPAAAQTTHRPDIAEGGSRVLAVGVNTTGSTLRVVPGTSSTALTQDAEGQKKKKKKKKKKKRRKNRNENDPNWVAGPNEDEEDTESSTERDEPGGQKQKKKPQERQDNDRE